MKSVEDAGQTEKKLRTCVTSLKSGFATEKDCIASFELNPIDEHSKGREIVVEQERALDTLKDQLRAMEEILRQVCAKLTVATSELETLHPRVEKSKKC